MARFRFTAAASDGTLHDGTIDAATAADARNKLAANGLAVREVEEVEGTAGTVPLDVPRRAAPKSSPIDSPNVPVRAPGSDKTAKSPRAGSPFALAFSLLALILAVATATYVVYRDPPGGRLSKYDFSTPESAYASYLRIEANGDFLAAMELQRQAENKQLREKIDTMRIERVRDLQGGKKVLFVEYQRKGTTVREVFYLQKDPDQKIWKQTVVTPQDVQGTNQALAREIQNWPMNGGHDGMFVPGMWER